MQNRILFRPGANPDDRMTGVGGSLTSHGATFCSRLGDLPVEFAFRGCCGGRSGRKSKSLTTTTTTYYPSLNLQPPSAFITVSIRSPTASNVHERSTWPNCTWNGWWLRSRDDYHSPIRIGSRRTNEGRRSNATRYCNTFLPSAPCASPAFERITPAKDVTFSL